MGTKTYLDPIILTINVADWYTGNAAKFTTSYVDLGTGVSTQVTGTVLELNPGVYNIYMPNLPVGEYNIYVENIEVYSTPFVVPLSVIPQTSTGSVTTQLTTVSADVRAAADTIATAASDMVFLRHMTAGRWVIVGTHMVFYAEDNVTEVARFELMDVDGVPTAEPSLARERVRL